MNRTLQRRIELLEARYVPAWEPLRVVITSIPSGYLLSPGERIVEDEFLEGEQRPYPLMITVNERVTTNSKDLGRRWFDQ